MNSAALQLVLNRGDSAQNKSLFDQLHNNKGDIEQTFGEKVTWRRMDDNKSSRIQYEINDVGLKNSSNWIYQGSIPFQLPEGITINDVVITEGSEYSYIDYNFDLDGKMNKTEQVKKVGNSVCPALAEALVRANMS